MAKKNNNTIDATEFVPCTPEGTMAVFDNSTNDGCLYFRVEVSRFAKKEGIGRDGKPFESITLLESLTDPTNPKWGFPIVPESLAGKALLRFSLKANVKPGRKAPTANKASKTVEVDLSSL